MPRHEMAPIVFAPQRRIAAVVLEQTIMPGRVEHDGGLQSLDNLLRDGYGIVVIAPHFSLREMFQVPFALAHESEEVARRRLLSPIAAHQYTPILQVLEKIMRVEFARIVTETTKQEEVKRKAKNKPIPWEIQKVGTGAPMFFVRARSFLDSNGLVLLAPQAKRMPYLEPFQGAPVEFLLRATRKVGKVGYAIIGVEIEGAETYEKDKVGGLNPNRPYIYRIGSVGTREELLESAAQNGHSVDMEVLRLMNEVAPPPYQARTPEGVLIFRR